MDDVLDVDKEGQPNEIPDRVHDAPETGNANLLNNETFKNS